MPRDDGFRLDNEQRRSPIVPQSLEPNPQGSVTLTETQAMTAWNAARPRVVGEEQEFLPAERREIGSNLAERKTK
jgi:hypothetical protein